MSLNPRDLRDERDRLVKEHAAEVERLREALAWYADPATYDAIGPLGTVKGTAWKLRDDMGARARAALRSTPPPSTY